MPAWIITGANRGIGLEFARQLSARRESVIATARHPKDAPELLKLDGVRVEKLDVADPRSIDAFARRFAREPVDVLVNNAGIGAPDRGIEELTRAELTEYFEVDTIGPVVLTRALLPALRAGGLRRVVNLSSGLASISESRERGWYTYRAAKAALNQLTRMLADELAREGFVCIVISPGWVRTDMGGPEAPLSPQESVRNMLRVLDRLSKSDNGKFLSHRGNEIPW